MKFLFLMSLITTNAFARDSLWQLCKGGTKLFGEDAKIAVNSFEHRAGADTRKDDIVLIYGGHLLSGYFDSTNGNSGKVVLTQGASQFVGKVDVNYLADSLTIAGVMKINGEETNLKSSLKCERMGD